MQLSILRTINLFFMQKNVTIGTTIHELREVFYGRENYYHALIGRQVS